MSRFYASSAGGSSGSTTVTLTAAPNGFWTDVPDQKFAYYNGKTYFGWVDGTTGDVKIASYTHSSGAVSTPFVLHAALGGTNGNPDDHDSPTILVRSSDHKIVVAYCAHLGAALYVRISTNAEDVTAFGAETNIDSTVGGTSYTYPGLVELTTEPAIYLWVRNTISTGAGRQIYTKSTDNGATWSAAVTLYGNTANTQQTYRRLTTNGTDRMDLFVTDTDRLLTHPSSLYHVYYTGGHWYRTDGTDTGKTASILPADMTLVKGTADGPACPLACGYDGGGKPVTLVMTYDSSTAKMWHAQETAGVWSSVLVTDTNGKVNGTNPFAIGAAIDRADVYTVWVPVKVLTKFEIKRFTSADSGATWTSADVTTGSSIDNISPDAIWNHASDVVILWPAGTWVSDQNFSFGIKGGY